MRAVNGKLIIQLEWPKLSMLITRELLIFSSEDYHKLLYAVYHILGHKLAMLVIRELFIFSLEDYIS